MRFLRRTCWLWDLRSKSRGFMHANMRVPLAVAPSPKPGCWARCLFSAAVLARAERGAGGGGINSSAVYVLKVSFVFFFSHKPGNESLPQHRTCARLLLLCVRCTPHVGYGHGKSNSSARLFCAYDCRLRPFTAVVPVLCTANRCLLRMKQNEALLFSGPCYNL